MNELKELETLESASNEISAVLQKYYQTDPLVADTMSLWFLSDDFKAMEKKAIQKAERVRFWEKYSFSKSWKKYWDWRKRNHYFIEGISAIIIGAILVITGFTYFIRWDMERRVPVYPRTAVVSESYRFSEANCTSASPKVCIPKESTDAYNKRLETLTENESAVMIGESGRRITLTKKNGQVILVENK